jgi:hypothetical protein
VNAPTEPRDEAQDALEVAAWRAAVRDRLSAERRAPAERRLAKAERRIALAMDLEAERVFDEAAARADRQAAAASEARAELREARADQAKAERELAAEEERLARVEARQFEKEMASLDESDLDGFDGGFGDISAAEGDGGDIQGDSPKEIADGYLKIARRNGLRVVSALRPGSRVNGGGTSDHAGPPNVRFAYDVSNGSRPTPEMDRTAREFARAMGVRWDGSGVVSTVGRGFRVQMLYRTNVGGNHFNHIHIGVSRRGAAASSRPSAPPRSAPTPREPSRGSASRGVETPPPSDDLR